LFKSVVKTSVCDMAQISTSAYNHHANTRVQTPLDHTPVHATLATFCSRMAVVQVGECLTVFSGFLLDKDHKGVVYERRVRYMLHVMQT